MIAAMAASGLGRVGWIGTGVMGASMCGHLLEHGHPISVFNRSRDRAADLIERGARWCETPADAAADAESVVTMVGFPADVREVILGDAGVLGAAAPGTLLIDMTTSEPLLAAEIHEAAARRGVEAVDAPVSGGDVGARNATLVIMAGGTPEAFERARPLFEVLGRTIVYQGGPGAGQHAKMVNQIAISSGMIGVCEALLYAQRAGLDVATVLDTISGGAAGSWSLSNLAPRTLRGDFEPGFKVDHFIKDLGIALAEARRMDLALPGLALAEQLYVATRAHGLGQRGTHALLLALADLSCVRWPAGPTGAAG
jgi:3-hydroxyisobutyrate dehydrogenase